MNTKDTVSNNYLKNLDNVWTTYNKDKYSIMSFIVCRKDTSVNTIFQKDSDRERQICIYTHICLHVCTHM